ncbi:phosphatidylinositol-binding protein scs2 [Coemansia spiralis]|nr:phosphatidylinositol-binding protein scs2 [Coemansia spiralis]
MRLSFVRFGLVGFFVEPFKTLTNTVLVLTNKNNGPAAFKVKTTAPKQYCVRPNAGRIEPGDSVTIQVSLQPMKGELPADFKCRDKFLIQSIQISPEMESMPMTELWAMVERDAKSSISEKKLRVRYLPSPPTDKAPADVAPAAESAEASSAAAVPVPQQRISPGARTLPGPSPLAKSVDSYEEPVTPTAADEKSALAGEAKRPSVAGADQPRPQTASDRLFLDSSAPSPADTTALAQQSDSSPSTPGNEPPSRTDLEAAKATIQELRRQLAEFKALQDKRPLPASTSASAGAGAAAAPARTAVSDSIDGLSMQSVAIVALVAFLVGYFFF